jgi:hypothetical protein
VVLNLEDREAPQLMVPLALSAAATAAFAIVGHQLVNPSPVQAGNFGDLSAATPPTPASRTEILANQVIFPQPHDAGLTPAPEDSEFDLFVALDRKDTPANAKHPGGAEPASAMTPAVEQGALSGGFHFDFNSGDGTFAGPSVADSGGGNSPVVSGEGASAGSSHQSQSAPVGNGTNSATLSTPNPTNVPTAASTLPASSAEANALAHSLAIPGGVQPLRSPRPKLGPTPRTGPTGPSILVTGPDAGSQPLVKAFDPTTDALKFTIMAYDSSFTGGVRVAVGDINGDGTPDIITAPGAGGGSLIKVFSGIDGSLLQSFNAYAPGQTDGAFVAAGDVNGDGHVDIITGTDMGAVPLVEVFSGVDDSVITSFNPDPQGPAVGVRVAAGDVSGNGYADIITGAGMGQTPVVTVTDGLTGQQVERFLAFDESFMGGVYIAAGDLNNDGHADIIVGQGQGENPIVRTFNGATLETMGDFLAYDASFGGGVRVAVEDVNADGQLDIVTGQGPGGGQVGSFDGQWLHGINTFTPYGGGFGQGLFVAGDGHPAAHVVRRVPPSSGATITISASPNAVFEPNGSPTTGTFTFTRSGDTSQTLNVLYANIGTGTIGVDYNLTPGGSSGSVMFLPGQTTVTLTMTTIDNNNFNCLRFAELQILANGMQYTVGTPSKAQIDILDDDSPPCVIPPPPCGCNGTTDIVGQNSNYSANTVSQFSDGLVRYGDGTYKLGMANLSSSGLGNWGQDLSWTNDLGYGTSYFGSGVIDAELPYLKQDGQMNVLLLSNGTTARMYNGGGVSTDFLSEHLADNQGAGTDTLTDTAGNQIVFYDFGPNAPAARRGLFKSFTDPFGNVTSVTSWTTANQPQEVQRSNTTNGTTVTESYLYTYNANNQVTNATLRRQVNGGAWSTVRQVAYTYSGSNLKLAQIEDASANVLDTYYARYTSTQSAAVINYFFSPQSYARLVAALGSNVDSLTDAQVAPYADVHFQYDQVNRVTTSVVQGAGCTSCGSGQGTYSYAYQTSDFANGYNNWQRRTTVGLPDGNQEIVYTNFHGEVLLKVFKEVSTGLTWATHYSYDSVGRLIETDEPSSVVSYSDTNANLGVTLSTSGGLSELTDYYTSTTATDTTAGGVAGYVQDTKVQTGGGNAILQSQTQYFLHGGGQTYAPVTTQTVYRNTDGTGGETTSYSYTWFTNTLQPQSVTVTRPVIGSGQNGPGVADSEVAYFDQYGRQTWHKDADGFIDYTEYDQATGAVTKTIADVDTTKTSDFMNLPSGWTTPSGGGLHLKSLMSVDSLGRPTKFTDPLGNVTYTVYLDTNYEVRTYAGWNSTTNLPTGPIQDSREDRPGSYMESLTYSATPHLTNGAPDGTEAISNIQSLSRSYTNSSGQMVRSDAYFSLSGVTYTTAQYIGTVNVNYYSTLFDYDERGRQNRVLLPTGTINRTVYDGLGRVVSTWVGTNDTPASGEWTPINNGGSSNMIQVTSNAYDLGTVPAAPTLSQTSGGSLAATKYYVKLTYIINGAETPASVESSLAVSANNLLQVTSPASVTGATGYNVYVASYSGGEIKQNTMTVAIGTNWTEPTTGLVSGTAAPANSGVGDGDASVSVQYPGGTAAVRVTQSAYDFRDRLVETKSGVQTNEDTTTHRPIFFYTLDNLSETTQVQRYDGDGVAVSTSAPSASLLRAQTNTSYDDQGRVYLTQVYSVNPSTGAVSSTALSTNTWYNHRGLVIETSQPGGLKTKNSYDGAGRTTVSYTTDGNGDAAPGTTNSWSNAGTVSGTNNVLVQIETSYDADGNVILTTTRQRNHDKTTGGPLGNETTTPKARVSFAANYYDLANRLTTTIDVGTNGTGTYMRPSTPPAASDTVLRTDTSYAGDSVQNVKLTGNPTGGTFTLSFNGQTTSAIPYNASAATVQSALQALSTIGSGNALVASPTGVGWVVRFAGTLAGAAQPALTGNGSGLTGGTNPSVAITVTSLGGDAGRVQQTTDPRGIISKTDDDWLGRTLRAVEAFSTFNPSGSGDKTTEYSYDGSSHMLTLQADLANSAYEQTKWIYGITTSGGSGVNSNDIVASMQYPDKTTGNPSPSEQETYKVDALGERTSFTDRNGNVHNYSFDVLARPTSDTVATLGSGVDGAVRRIDTAYDTQGNAYLFTSYADTGGTTIANQVQRAFNGLGQLIEEWQSHSGAVNTSTTPNVQYGYSLMAGGANHSRLTSLTYPNGKVLNYNYNSGLDDSISRLSSLFDSSGTLEAYTYLGLDTVVKRAHPQPNVDLTYIGSGTGDAGDQYTGLDRFGRIVEQKWWNNTTITATDDFKYGYDRDSNRLYRTNELNHNFDELYHVNGSGNGYDNLNQLIAFARGVLNASHDTITSPTHSITWSLDALGNFTSTT